MGRLPRVNRTTGTRRYRSGTWRSRPAATWHEMVWGEVPRGVTKLRILFEVRWDDRSADAAPSRADVYFDDLYVGG